jgi:hypothetical protein
MLTAHPELYVGDPEALPIPAAASRALPLSRKVEDG